MEYQRGSVAALFFVVFVLLHDAEGVLAGGGEIHLGEEGFAVGFGGAFIPAQDVGAAGVVIGKRVRDGVVGCFVALHHFGEIEGAAHDVFAWIGDFLVVEVSELLVFGPLEGGVFADLHEADLAGAAADPRTESALLPNDGFNEGGIEIVAPGGGFDLGVVTNGRAIAIKETEIQREGDNRRAAGDCENFGINQSGHCHGRIMFLSAGSSLGCRAVVEFLGRD
jgi:hypothetical protein